MSTFKEEIEAQIARDKAEIGILENHLASGEVWLEQEASSLWQRFKHLFTSAAANPPLPSTPPPESPAPAGIIPPQA